MAYTKGGDKLKKVLENLSSKATDKKVSVGFFEGAAYPDGLPVAMVAFWNEYGNIIQMPAREQTIYRKLNKNGDFLKKGQFVKKEKSNFETTHAVGAHVINVPPRPFFRNAIEKNQEEWIRKCVFLLKQNDFNVDVVLEKMGNLIKNNIQESIVNFKNPPNAPSTIKKKGFDAPLRETKQMLNSVDYKIENGNGT